MNEKEQVLQRSGGVCELCGTSSNLQLYEIKPRNDYILICDTCLDNINHPGSETPRHWRCLNESMWSEVPIVQALIYRILESISSEGWPQDLLDMMYIDDDTKILAEEMQLYTQVQTDPTLDSNGNVLNTGDSVIIIKDLEVKGAGFTAKRGTVVKNISLSENKDQIEGRVNGTRIVLLSKFLKKV